MKDVNEENVEMGRREGGQGSQKKTGKDMGMEDYKNKEARKWEVT